MKAGQDKAPDMKKKFLKGISLFFLLLLLLVVILIDKVDRSPYQEEDFYTEMLERLDSLEGALPAASTGPLQAGWSRLSITPDTILPLAGYGARKPKEMEGIADSVFVRSIVFDNGSTRAALLSADLLIVHPEVRIRFDALLRNAGWDPEKVLITATHSHSSVGAWAPGLVGGLFSGDYDVAVVEWLAERLAQSVLLADQQKQPASLGFNEFPVEDLVFNRLVKEEGIIDPWLKTLQINRANEKGLAAFYSAHATCYGRHYHELTGDYPVTYHKEVLKDSLTDYSWYGAGAVASMGYKTPPELKDEGERALYMGSQLAAAAKLLIRDSLQQDSLCRIRAFRVAVPLRDPNFKISQELRLRPWVFNEAFGDYPTYLSFLQLNNTLIIGTPCDFSGELAMDLYAQMPEGSNLIISSFNGGYIGYIPDDRWYDRERYETRTMAWYGHDNGAYFTEVMERIALTLLDRK